jgi:hypothetical protein
VTGFSNLCFCGCSPIWTKPPGIIMTGTLKDDLRSRCILTHKFVHFFSLLVFFFLSFGMVPWMGDHGSTMVKVLCYKSEGSWFDPRWCHGTFHWHKSFWSHYGPGVNSASNRNEYQEYCLGGKCGRCVRLTTLPPSCAVVKKSGNLNLLEPSGPLQACNGTALPLWCRE